MIGVHAIRIMVCYWFQDIAGVLGPPIRARGSKWLLVKNIPKANPTLAELSRGQVEEI